MLLWLKRNRKIMNKAVIIGGGDFARKLIRLIQKSGQLEILGYTDKKNKGNIFGIKDLGNDNELGQIINKNKECCAFIGIAGNFEYIRKRSQIVDKLKRVGYHFPALISPNSSVETDVTIGEGTIIFDDVYVDFGCKLGKHSVINIKSLVCHDTTIGDYVTVSPAATIGGGTKVGDNSFIGIHSTINAYITISEKCIIGAGAVVVKDCKESGTYVGNPAGKIK